MATASEPESSGSKWLIKLGILIAIILLGLATFKGFNDHNEQISPDNKSSTKGGPNDDAKQEIAKLKEKIKQLKKEKDLFHKRALTRLAILKKFHLPIPDDNELNDFNVTSYFCTNWCSWSKKNLPKIKKDAQKKCNPCEKKTPKKPTIKQKHKEITVTKSSKKVTRKKPPRKPRKRSKKYTSPLKKTTPDYQGPPAPSNDYEGPPAPSGNYEGPPAPGGKYQWPPAP